MLSVCARYTTPSRQGSWETIGAHLCRPGALFSVNSPVFTSLIPVILFIAIGFYVGRRGWIRAESVKDLANLVFMVLTPALLFRTMSTVHIEDLNFGPVGIYFVAFGVVYAATLAVQGFNTLGAARALSLIHI